MRKKLLFYGAGAVAVVVVVLAATTLFAEKVGVAEIAAREGTVLDQATLQGALAYSADCAGFTITEVTPTGKGTVLAKIEGMRGQCCLDPAKTALQRASGVERVEITLQRK